MAHKEAGRNQDARDTLDKVLELNPEYNVTLLLISTMIRGVMNIVGIAGLSWFAGQLAWCTLKTGRFPKWFGYYSWLNVAPGFFGLAIPFAGFAYLWLFPLWMLLLSYFLMDALCILTFQGLDVILEGLDRTSLQPVQTHKGIGFARPKRQGAVPCVRNGIAGVAKTCT